MDRLRDPNADPPGILLGSRLAEDLGMRVGDNIELLTDEMLPVGHTAGEAALQSVRPLRDRLLRDRRQLGVPVDRRGAEGALGGPDQPDRTQRGRSESRAGDRQGSGKGGGRPLHDHHLDGAQQATAGRAQDGAAGDHHRDQPDRTGGGAEYFHHAGDDGDGEVPRHRGADVDGRAAASRSAGSSCCRAC